MDGHKMRYILSGAVAFVCLFLSLVPSFAQQKVVPQGRLEEEMDYIVKNGDTLWGISERFYGDPFLWPRLWQQNQYVTNPHQIYPGDRIRLYPYKVLIELEEEAKPLEVKPPPAPPVSVEEAPPLPPIPEVIRLTVYPEVRSAGFVADRMEGVGMIVGSKVDKLLLVAEDEVYISFQKGISVKAGDVFTIFRLGKVIKHPALKKLVLGRKIEILGTAVITRAKEGEAPTALITKCYDTISLGDMVTPYFPEREEIKVGIVAEPKYGWIVASKLDKLELAEGDVVYIDLGEKDKVQPGDVFHVMRRGKVIRDPASKGKDLVKLPDEIVARLVVIKTLERTATAILVQSRVPVHVGDPIKSVVD